MPTKLADQAPSSRGNQLHDLSSRSIRYLPTCGEFKQLSFEHVPPRAAYNETPLWHPDIQDLFRHRLAAGRRPQMHEEPRGAGGYTMCGDCNNRCSRYARQFVDWAVYLRHALDSDPRAIAICASQVMWRSRVMKEIVAMFLSANSPNTGAVNPGLRRFVWNAEYQGLPDGIRVFAALTRDDRFSRQVGFTGILRSHGTSSMLSEIAFAPLSLVMTFGGTDAGETRLTDISFFANSAYKRKETTAVTLQVLELRDIYPATCR